MHYWGYPNMMGWGFGLGGILSFVLFVLFWVFVALLIATVVRSIRHNRLYNNGKDGEEDSAMEILKKRYAKGEINKREFEEAKKTIKND